MITQERKELGGRNLVCVPYTQTVDLYYILDEIRMRKICLYRFIYEHDNSGKERVRRVKFGMCSLHPNRRSVSYFGRNSHAENLSVGRFIYEHDNSGMERVRRLKFGMWSLRQNCRSVWCSMVRFKQ
ncbi:hypothetical protein AVEN_38969-1 [Araneus ventricosus]|uniref:Uncharacterized protein n=1 Tax=Araneus ventricosus TaxID=182803 RepID=A0A4Y2IHS7_ARAVE|nr:hypothetical protein AVEN_38969-1 [Araneus ventricosus]